MSRFLKKVFAIVEDNVVLIGGVSVIIATHWGWSRLQHTNLVPEEKRKDLPIILGYKHLKSKAMEKFNAWKSSEKATVIPEQK